MNKKYYILHYPSLFGMGSNTDNMLISDKDVRYIIRNEVRRKNEGDRRFCDRFTGTWNGETFCDSNDMAEVEEDVIRKRMNSCSTYAGVNDLIELPADMPLTIIEQKEENRIFHIWNQRMDCFNDIIAGETVFFRHFLELPKGEDFAGLHEGEIHEFVSFDMKRVLRNSYFMNEIDTVLETEKTRYLRFQSKVNGTYKVGEDKYLDDLIDLDDEVLYKRFKKEWEDVTSKFAEPITCKDTYLKHFYTASPNRHLREALMYDMMQMSKSDHRQFAYEYPRHTSIPGAIYSEVPKSKCYFRYDELFKAGCDIRYFPAINTDSYSFKDEIKGVEAFWALRNVFGTL